MVLGGGLHEDHAVGLGEGGCLILGDFSSGLGESVLAVEVVLVADEHDGEFLIGVIFGFLNPLGEVVEGKAVGDIVHEDGCDGAPIIGSRDRFEHLLSCLATITNPSTVSQICIFIFFSPISTILDPNYTPIVVSLSYLNLLSRNCIKTQDFPTPKSHRKY